MEYERVNENPILEKEVKWVYNVKKVLLIVEYHWSLLYWTFFSADKKREKRKKGKKKLFLFIYFCHPTKLRAKFNYSYFDGVLPYFGILL